MEFDYYKYCLSTYQKEYNRCYKQLQKAYKGKASFEKKQDEWAKESQKSAIRVSVMKGLNEIESPSVSELWSALYRVHLYKKSGIKDLDTIQKVISADESWKKSSGHAFEEMIKELASLTLEGTDVSIILQRDLNTLIKAGELDNEPRDISWLKDQIKGNIFDLYCIVTIGDKKKCFGCVQCKTSIRDRVTRDREPSLHACSHTSGALHLCWMVISSNCPSSRRWSMVVPKSFLQMAGMVCTYSLRKNLLIVYTR